MNAFALLLFLAAQEPQMPTHLAPDPAVQEEEKAVGQVFFRFAITWLTDDRGEEVFTDTLGAGGRENDDDRGWAAGAGLDLALWPGMFEQVDLVGEIFVEYAEFSSEDVVQATSALLGAPEVTRVTVSQLTVAVAPKIRIDLVDGDLRPWIIPIGMAFLVSNPPSNDTTYLDFGVTFGVGADYRIAGPLRVGVDFRYVLGFGRGDVDNDYWSIGLNLGIDF